MTAQILNLADLAPNDIPPDLRPDTYFDFQKFPFEHQEFIEQSSSVYAVIRGIRVYAESWLENTIAARESEAVCVLTDQAPEPALVHGHFNVVMERGVIFKPARVIGAPDDSKRHTLHLARNAVVMGADIYLDSGSIFIGDNTRLEPSAGIKGPTILGSDGDIRQGAYIRGDCVVGKNATLRGEIKNCVLMNNASFPHPSYLGDSVCGYQTHFGNQATTANFGIYAGAMPTDKRKPIIVDCNGEAYSLGNPKMGICMGDFCQVGCNAVSDPGTFLKPYTVVYALTRIPKGFYGPYEVLKNKPLEHGIVERVPLRPLL